MLKTQRGLRYRHPMLRFYEDAKRDKMKQTPFKQRTSSKNGHLKTIHIPERTDNTKLRTSHNRGLLRTTDTFWSDS